METNKKQTAVEWLLDELNKLNSSMQNMDITPEEYHKRKIYLSEKAKQMQREQMLHAWCDGSQGEVDSEYFDEYYKQTYGKK